MNLTFIALILKVDHSIGFGDFRLTTLCNMTYKVVAKILSLRIRPLLSNVISDEWFRFL